MIAAKLISKPVFNTLQKHTSPRWLMVMIFPVLILNAWLGIKTLQYFQLLVAIAPRLLGRFTGLKPAWILIALFIGTKLFGWLGLIVSVPLAGFVKDTLHELRNASVDTVIGLEAPATSDYSPLEKQPVQQL